MCVQRRARCSPKIGKAELRSDEGVCEHMHEGICDGPHALLRRANAAFVMPERGRLNRSIPRCFLDIKMRRRASLAMNKYPDHSLPGRILTVLAVTAAAQTKSKSQQDYDHEYPSLLTHLPSHGRKRKRVPRSLTSTHCSVFLLCCKSHEVMFYRVLAWYQKFQSRPRWSRLLTLDAHGLSAILGVAEIQLS